MRFGRVVLGGIAVVAALGVFSCGCKNNPPPKVQSCNCSSQKVEKKSFTTLTLRADTDFLPTLLEKGFRFSYYDGLVSVEVAGKKGLEELLSLYGDYLKRKKTVKVAGFTVSKLIEEDIKNAKARIEYWSKQYEQYASVLAAQGVEPDFSVFDNLITLKEKRVFELYSSYWDQKFKQLMEGFKFAVKEPRVEVNRLIAKARDFYGDDLKVSLFKAYLMRKLNEARLEADLYKYKEYGSGN